MVFNSSIFLFLSIILGAITFIKKWELILCSLAICSFMFGDKMHRSLDYKSTGQKNL